MTKPIPPSSSAGTARSSVFSPAEWERAGRGSELQFFATDDEVQGWLTSALPGESAGYSLIGTDLEKGPDSALERPFVCSIDALSECASGGSKPRHQFWIWSRLLLPDLDPMRSQPLETTCAVNGLILLQHGFVRRGRQEASRISIVRRIRHRQSGREALLREPVRIFKALADAIRRQLCYSTIQVFRDGHQEEDRNLQLMTAAAARLAADGRFSRRPGSHLG